MLITQESGYRLVDVTADDVNLWKRDKVTQGILKLIISISEEFSQRLATGETLGKNVEQATARVVGAITGLGILQEIIEARFEEVKDEANND